MPAEAFLASLDPAQRDTVTFPIDSDNWLRWSNVHIYLMRHGLLLEDLDDRQRAAALDLLRASLSSRGFDDVRTVMRFNEVLADITGSHDEYGEWAYFLSLFGTPSEDEPWGWQLDGHHLNLHCFVLGDQLVLTPAFLGTEPCRVATGPARRAPRVRRREREGLAMVRSLSDEQARTAVLYPSVLQHRPAPRAVGADRRSDDGLRVPATTAGSSTRACAPTR